MTFKPAIWYPIAAVLSVVNLVAVAFATSPAEPWHATTHAALALAFGLWAQYLRKRRGTREAATDTQGKIGEPLQEHIEALEGEMSQMRQELSEAQERLDFAERLLAQERDARRMGPQRPGP